MGNKTLPLAFKQPSILDSLSSYSENSDTPLGSIGSGYSGVPSSAAFASGISDAPTNWWDNLTSSFFKTKDPTSGITTGGIGDAAIGIGGGLANAYMGWKQFQLAQDTLKENKKQFAMNYGAQRTATNNDIDSRNFARNAANPGVYQPLNRIA